MFIVLSSAGQFSGVMCIMQLNIAHLGWYMMTEYHASGMILLGFLCIFALVTDFYYGGLKEVYGNIVFKIQSEC